jgi:hypothetical protein
VGLQQTGGIGRSADSLERIGDDPEARYRFFKLFVELAKETVGGDCQRSADGSPD